jgi:hypothetical protein
LFQFFENFKVHEEQNDFLSTWYWRYSFNFTRLSN